MKIFHTADWHIGKLVHQVHLTTDQKYILKKFVDLIKEEQPDVIIIAGDLYDRSVPPVEAVELLDDIFTEILIDLNIPILAIAGNHDSPDRVGFGSQVMRNRGLHIVSKFNEKIEPIVLHDNHGPVNFYLLPYADPAIIRDLLNTEEIKSHDDAMRLVINRIKENLNTKERNILVTHAYVLGNDESLKSESERPLSIGGSEYVDVSYFEEFHYTALGHLHGPQKISSEKVRYAGSLMKYSFSETNQHKSITIVEMDCDGNIEVYQRSLEPIRDMRKIKGKLEDLLNPETYRDTAIDDYIMVILEDEGEIIDPIGKLRAVYPNVLRVERESYNREIDNQKTSAGQDHNQKSKLELFRDFYSSVVGKDFNEEKAIVLMEILREVDKEERGA